MRKATVLALLPSLAAAAWADRGLLFVGRPSVSIYEPGQKAVVAWNKGTEVMILSTDTRAPEEGRALGVVPLPSAPEVEKGSLDSFVAVQRLIWRHAPRLPALLRGKGPGAGPPAGVKILFHKRIGAHDVTAVEAGSVEAFVNWAERFARERARSSLGTLPERWKAVVRDYIQRGVRFFVFDLVEVGREERTVEPLVYTFKSRRPFYPLLISRLTGGLTTVQVFLITPHVPDVFSMQGPLSVATYKVPFGWRPILFKASQDELRAISPKVARLFGRAEAYFCALEYRGPTMGLSLDFELGGFLRPVALSLRIRKRG